MKYLTKSERIYINVITVIATFILVVCSVQIISIYVTF